MFTPHNHDTLLTYLLGLILLVLAAVGAMTALEGLGSASNDEMRFKEQQRTMADLKSTHGRIEGRLRAVEQQERLQHERMAGIEVQQRILRERVAAATRDKQQLEQELAAVEGAYAATRSVVRERVRRAAVGRFLGDLKTNSGQVYPGARIREVTDHGIWILYEGGSAEVPAGELPAAMHEAYQWGGRSAAVTEPPSPGAAS